MDTQTAWIYPEFFQASRDYILHLQQIAILLISAISIVLYNNRNTKDLFFIWIIIFSFLCSLGSLIIGLYSYSDLLSKILEFKDGIDLREITCLINIQFFLDIIALIFLAISLGKLIQASKRN